LTTDCNSRYVFADPYVGGQIAVAEAARNIICSGGEPCAIIGEVTDTGNVEYYFYDECVASIPAESLVLGGGAPVYDRAYEMPTYFEKIKEYSIDSINTPSNLVEVAKILAESINLSSKKWIFEQYDSMIGTNTMTTNTKSDAAIVRVKGTKKALALTTDCNSRYVFADPYVGGQIAVAEAARNIICSGGEPCAITNCLNFGNPYEPEVYYQFVHALKGMGEACEKFNTPVTGGNVSFYNQSVYANKTVPVYPTPTIGMLGILDDCSQQMSLNFKKEADFIYVIGQFVNDISSSEYLRKYHDVEYSPAPYFNLDEEFSNQQAVRLLIKEGLVNAAHDVSEGGLFFALAEMAYEQKLGFSIHTDKKIRKDAFLFGESQSRIVVTVSSADKDRFEMFVKSLRCHFSLIGEVVKENFVVDGEQYGTILEYNDVYENNLSKILN
nr:phosphoribosylformylglycinamidine synthase subunit PurL [Chitinophagaceae bacterium]